MELYKIVEQSMRDKSLSQITRNTFKMVKSEWQRDRDKVPTDERVVSIVKSMVMSAEEMSSILDKDHDKIQYDENEDYIKTLSALLPKQVSVFEIREWVGSNIDFTKLKSPMQAIGMVKKQFGTTVDGNVVKQIIQDMT